MQPRLPKLPGYAIEPHVRRDFRKAHYFDVAEPDRPQNVDRLKATSPLPSKAREIPSKSTFEASSEDFAVGEKPASSRIRLGVKEASHLDNPPQWLKYDQVVLRFGGFFVENVYNNPFETERIRELTVLYYCADDTIGISEKRYANSGISQGAFLKRQKVPRSGNPNKSIKWPDFEIGKSVCIFGRDIHVTSCDKFTRSFFSEHGVALAPDSQVPRDSYSYKLEADRTHVPPSREVSDYIEAKLGRQPKATLLRCRQYLKHDREVLRFYAVWDDKTLFGQKHKFAVNYFLATDEIEVQMKHEPNSGIDPFPALLKRTKLPKDTTEAHARQDKIGVDHEFDRTTFVSYNDIKVGGTLTVWGRELLIVGCDPYTKEWYINNMGMTEKDMEDIPVEEETYDIPRAKTPPHNGFGSEEDSRRSVHSLMPKPARPDYSKMVRYEKKTLRFLARMISKFPDDTERRFVISYFLGDDTVSIYEKSRRNSGYWEGKFLERGKHKNTDTSELLKAADFYVGATIAVNSFRFELLEADEATLRTMEGDDRGLFPDADANELIRVLARQIDTNLRLSHLTETFRQFDKDKSTFIDQIEFNALLEKYGWFLNQQQVLTLFRNFDTNRDGTIDLNEFFAAIEYHRDRHK